MKRLIALFLALLATGLEAASGTDYSLTIYSRAQPGAVDPALYRPGRYQSGTVPGYAVVRQTQSENLAEGISQLRVQDVASLIDPTTVSMRSLQDEGSVRVLEQSFEFDLVSSDKLLDRYLDRSIAVVRDAGESATRITGTLLSTDGGLVLRLPDGTVQIVTRYSEAILPDLPGGLITRPTLVWQVQAAQAGARDLQISYQTEGMTWWTDYNAALDDEQGCSLDLNAWVSIVNQSGAGFPEARLKLIAGDVQRVDQPDPRVAMERVTMAKDQGEAGFKEQPFFEYHLYTLPRRTSIPNNSTKQLELFPAAPGVPCSREYIHDTGGFAPAYFSEPVLDRHPGWMTDRNDVAVYLAFRNNTASKLGMPLPAGRLRVNKLDRADGSLEFVGEDVLEHTPRDEDVRVRLGNAFDIVVERRQTDFHVDTQSKTMRESFELELRNHKETSVTVQLREVLYRWANWKVIQSSHDFETLDARSIQFPVSVEPDQTKTVRYEVQYTW